MTIPLLYPGAILHPITHRSGLIYIDTPWRLVLHTTETKGLPNYTSPPHITINPVTGTVWQHINFDRGSYALRHPSGSVETNRTRALQVEIIGYAKDAATYGTSLHLAKMLHWFEHEFNIRRTNHPVFKLGCYGTGSVCRMLEDEWLLFDGICGHEHVPGNTHWDPGALPVDALLALPTDPVVSVPDPLEDDMPDPRFSDETAARLNQIADADKTDLTGEGAVFHDRWVQAVADHLVTTGPTDLVSKQELAAVVERAVLDRVRVLEAIDNPTGPSGAIRVG